MRPAGRCGKIGKSIRTPANEAMQQPEEAAMRRRFHALLLIASLPILGMAEQAAAADCFQMCVARGGASGYRPVIRPESGCARMCARRARRGVPPGESIRDFLRRKHQKRAYLRRPA